MNLKIFANISLCKINIKQGQRSSSGSTVARKGLERCSRQSSREKLQREVGLKTVAENREGLDSRQREAGLRLDQDRRLDSKQRESGLGLDPDRESLVLLATVIAKVQ